MLSAEWTGELSESQLVRVGELLRAARETDGRPDLEESGALPREFRGGLHLLASDPEVRPDELVAYAHLDTEGDAFGRQVAELVVRPAVRRGGYGTELVRAVLDRADREVRFWSHGDHPGAAGIAGRFGLRRVRELLRMRLEFANAPELPALVPPEGVRIRAFRPGVDEAAVIAVNAKAFDWHPEQGRLSVADLRATEEESWFDPRGFFLAVDARSPAEAEVGSVDARSPAEAEVGSVDARSPAEAEVGTRAVEAEQVLGFHWTKVHPSGEGEVYVVGVDPAAQGRGLGKVLTLAGLHYLREIGRPEVILYVEGDNGPAVSVYEGLGFRRASTDVQYGS